MRDIPHVALERFESIDNGYIPLLYSSLERCLNIRCCVASLPRSASVFGQREPRGLIVFLCDCDAWVSGAERLQEGAVGFVVELNEAVPDAGALGEMCRDEFRIVGGEQPKHVGF